MFRTPSPGTRWGYVSGGRSYRMAAISVDIQANRTIRISAQDTRAAGRIDFCEISHLTLGTRLKTSDRSGASTASDERSTTQSHPTDCSGTKRRRVIRTRVGTDTRPC